MADLEPCLRGNRGCSSWKANIFLRQRARHLLRAAIANSGLVAIICVAVAATSCRHSQGPVLDTNLPVVDPPGLFAPKRLVVIKVVQGYGDFQERDTSLVTGLCIAKYKGSITQEQFDEKYSGRDVRLISGPPIKYSVHTEVDERFTVTEDYIDQVSVPSYIDGVAMNDGKTIAVKKQREVVKGRLRSIYGQCTAFEYHF